MPNSAATDMVLPLSESWVGIFGSHQSGVTTANGAEAAFSSLFVVDTAENTTMMSMHEAYAVTGANPYNTPPTLGDGLSYSIIVGADADEDTAEALATAADISIDYWKNEFINRWNNRGGAVISDPGIELIYILQATPWWNNKNTTDVLQEINAVRNYNKYMRILCNLEIGADDTSKFDYTLGGPSTAIHSQIGYNVHLKIVAKTNSAATLIKDIISKFVDELNAVKCNINLINDKGVVDVTGVMGCIGVKLDEFIYSDSANNDKISHFLRHLVPFIDTDTNNKGGGLAMASFSDFEAEKYSDISANPVRSNTTIKDKVFELRQYQQWLCHEVCGKTTIDGTDYDHVINDVREVLRPKYGGCDEDPTDTKASKCSSLNETMRTTSGGQFAGSQNMRDEIITNHYLDPRKYDLKLSSDYTNYNDLDIDFGDNYSYPAQPIGDGTIRDIDTELNEMNGFTTSQTGGVRINGILRKVGNVPTGTIFYSASPFCHSPVKDLVKNLSHDSKVKISPEGRNHLETDVRSWFWSRTKYEDRVKFYDTMKTIIDDDETVRNSLTYRLQDDVTLWKELIKNNIDAIKELDNQYTLKNKEQKSTKLAKNSAVQKINALYNDKIFSEKKRFNKIMNIIHFIVIMHVIMYIWNMVEAADGNDPMQGIKDLQEEIKKQREAEKKERATVAAAAAAKPPIGGGMKGGNIADRIRKMAPKMEKKESSTKDRVDKRKEEVGPLFTEQASDPFSVKKAQKRDNDRAASGQPSATYPKANAGIEAMRTARDITKSILGESTNDPVANIPEHPPWGSYAGLPAKVAAGVSWLIRFFVVMVTSFISFLTYHIAFLILFSFITAVGLIDLIPKAYVWGKETISNIGEFYKRRTNALTFLINLIPAIALFYTVGLWFAPTYGLGICIAYAIFVQLKMTAFILFGAKNANLTKAHLRKCRYGLTFMTLLMIGYNANQNLKFNTGIGVTLAFTACMFIMLCR